MEKFKTIDVAGIHGEFVNMPDLNLAYDLVARIYSEKLNAVVTPPNRRASTQDSA